MRNLLTSPAYQESDLGMPLPDTRHACSVCLPNWQTVIDYEEGRDKVMRALKAGYPRFVLHPDVEALIAKAQQELCVNGEKVLLFPSKLSAQRAQRFIERQTNQAVKVEDYHTLYALIYSEDLAKHAKLYWRYTGEVVSSRQAEDVLTQKTVTEPVDLRTDLANLFQIEEELLHIWTSGMSSIFQCHRFASQKYKARKSLQIGFPYVDAMRVQQSFGSGVVFLSHPQGEDFNDALKRIQNSEFSSVFVEVPSNPLLRTPPLKEIFEACQASNTPLFVDDTICSHHNVEVLSLCDAVTTSLTKWISGKGDVMAGATRINPDSAFKTELIEFFQQENAEGSCLYPKDALTLKANLAGFSDRMDTINANTLAAIEVFQANKDVVEVFHPSITGREAYDSIKKEGGGYGGLFSVVFKNEKAARQYFDEVKISKGPSLGTEFSLVSPYTMLAHYDELKWAESCDVSPYLLRFSIGIEPIEELLERFRSVS